MKNIPGYNRFQINECGLVFDKKRNKYITPFFNAKYYRVSLLNDEGIRKIKGVHRFMAITFLGLDENSKMHVDHIDNNKLNNNLSNLQVISQRENNSKDKFRKGKTSKYTGVHWSQPVRKWKAQIYKNGKVKYLGLFDSEHEAFSAYQYELLTP